ncbi:MAG: hypothetical protein P8100_05635 [bacterium]
MKKIASLCSLLLIVLLFSNNMGFSQTIEKSRSYTETFKTGPETEIEIINKYGDIHLIPWKKDSVRFEIEVMVRGTKQSKVDKSYDYIEIDFKDTKYYVIAQTLFAGKSSFWSDVSDLTGAIFNSGTKTKIDYTVYLPARATLKVTNKYGNIYTTNHTGKVELRLSNGDLKAHHFAGPVSIESEFGDINVKKIDDGILAINYGECFIEEAGKISLTGKSSEFHIDNATTLNMDSRRDKLFLGSVDKLSGSTNFSLLELEEVAESLVLNAKYGDIDISGFSDKLQSFSIWTNDTDLTLHFTDDKQYEMDIKVDDRTQVLYSADITNITSRELGGEDNLIQVDCIVGKDKKLSKRLEINANGGSISLKLK